MNPLATSAIVLAFLVAGASFGFLLRAVLPPHHLSEQSKDTIKLAVGLVGTMVALILGLLVASAKSFFDAQSAELTQMAAQVVCSIALWRTMDRQRRERGIYCAPAHSAFSNDNGHKLLRIRLRWIRHRLARKPSPKRLWSYRRRTTCSAPCARMRSAQFTISD